MPLEAMAPMPPMPPVPAGAFDAPADRARRRIARAHRQAARRSAWWCPFAVAGWVLVAVWGLLRADQFVADQLFWPTSGAQFAEVGPIPADPTATGGPLVVVAGGLNRKSGTGPALALMPALSADHARVFSLVYGSGINDRDVEDKFDALLERIRPSRVDFFGSSMGGDVVLNLAAHLQRTRDEPRWTSAVPDDRPIPAQVGDRRAADASRARPADPATPAGPAGPAAAPVARGSDRGEAPAFVVAAAATGPRAGGGPRLGTIYLDCTPLSTADVRQSSRTRADAITALSEALHTDGGVGVRLATEVFAQQEQWSTGRLPFVDIRWGDLTFKIHQVWLDKIGAPGISTQLVKDQYGVIRRIDVAAVAHDLGAGARLVYFRPEDPAADRTVRVAAAQATLDRLAADVGFAVIVAPIPDGHHASAETDSATYLAALELIGRAGAS
jgi:hypothetical protein